MSHDSHENSPNSMPNWGRNKTWFPEVHTNEERNWTESYHIKSRMKRARGSNKPLPTIASSTVCEESPLMLAGLRKFVHWFIRSKIVSPKYTWRVFPIQPPILTSHPPIIKKISRIYTKIYYHLCNWSPHEEEGGRPRWNTTHTQ